MLRLIRVFLLGIFKATKKYVALIPVLQARAYPYVLSFKGNLIVVMQLGSSVKKNNNKF